MSSMKETWQSYLQIGIVHSMAFPQCLGGEGPQLETLRQICHDPFFEAVDVVPIVDPVVRRACGALLRDCRMSVTLACQPTLLRQQLDLNAADEATRRKAVDTVLACLVQAEELGAGCVAVMSGKNVPAAEQPAAHRRLIDSLKQICKAAHARGGLRVILEVFDYDVDKKALIGTCAGAATLAGPCGWNIPASACCTISATSTCVTKIPAKHFPLLREHLHAVHMGSSVSDPKHARYGDSHPLFGMPGGDSDIPAAAISFALCSTSAFCARPSPHLRLRNPHPRRRRCRKRRWPTCSERGRRRGGRCRDCSAGEGMLESSYG